MTQILISSPVQCGNGFAVSSKSSTTTSVVALTPSADDASVVGDDSVDPDIPIRSVETEPQGQSLALIDSFDGSFTWRSPSPIAPSISFTPPPSSSVSARAFVSTRPPRTRRSRSPATPARSTAINVGVDSLPLSSSGAPENTGASSSGPATPRIAATAVGVTPESELPSPGAATPATTAPPSITSQSGARDTTAEVFDLLAMRAAIDLEVSLNPVTPRPSAERQHLSPTPTPTPNGNTHRRRRSSSAIRQPRHEVSDEEPPTNRFHQSDFQQAFRDAKQLMDNLSNVLATNQLHNEPDSTMKRLYQEAQQLSTFTCPETRTVGFVGDSGVGKSSLINSLLDIKGLARTSSSGSACTCVVTEYCYRAEPGFEIQVEYFNKEDLQMQLSELLESYRHYHLSYDDLSGDELVVFKERAQVAEDTFRAMFRVQLRDIKEALLRSGDEPTVLRTLMSWVDNSPHSTTAKETLADAASCSQRLMELTSDLASQNESALWPFIRRIRVYSDAHILSKGLILVDLPGLRDINSARRRITERYILNCDEIFAVCNIIRAITDEGVMAVIELANKAELSNVGIICTRSDDIQAEEAKKDWKGERARSVEAIQGLVTAAMQNLREIEEQVKELDEIDSDDLLDEEKDAYIRLRRRAAEAKNLVEQREFELKKFLVENRNAVVRQQLREAYVERIPGDDLSVFCVSNVDYWNNRDLPKDVSLDFLELSGMIEVRKHCISIVAESQLRTATLFMKENIPALVDSLRLWVQSGSGSLSAERKIAIRDTLDKAERKLRKGLTEPDSELNKMMVKEPLRHFLSQYQHKENWAEGAENAADKWSGWHHSSYAAFCRNFGNHSTRVAGSHNWNEEAIESMILTLSPKWREMCTLIETRNSNVTSVLETLCEEAVDILVSEEALDDEQQDILTSSIRIHQNLLESKLEVACDNVRKDLAKLKTDVLSGIDTSFIGQAMNPSYRACNRESGSGSDSRRKGIINRRLRGEDIFTEMEQQLKACFKAIAAELRMSQMEAARAHFQVIKENLDMLRDDNVILESESDPEFRMRVDEEVRRVKVHLDGILACL